MTQERQKNWQVQPEQSGTLLRLQNLIQRGSGFGLLILQQNRPSYRDGLIAFLGRENSRVLNLKKLGDFAAFEAELEQQGQNRMLHLINLESLGEEKKQSFFKGLNYHREHIARTCAGILAFWLPEPLVREMALQAADFWAWREQVLDFSLSVEPVERVAFDRATNWNIEVSRKQARIKEIESFFVHSVEQPSLAAADLKRELGNLYESIGEYNRAQKMQERAISEYKELDEAQAEAAAQRDLARLVAAQGDIDESLLILTEKILPVFQKLGNEVEEANTFGEIATVLYDLGDHDKALEIRRRKQLPIYERLNHNRSKAVTLVYIADILYKRSQPNEALRIYKTEVLPVYEKIGDDRERAIVMGKIADILQDHGQFDQALRIRQNEELPIYERLGETREKGLTQSKIADILRFRGQFEEALKIYKNKVLPVFEKLNDVRLLMFTRVNYALLLHEIDAEANKERIEELLRLALAAARRLKLPGETELIENIMKKFRIKAQ
ncbi:tetratricopeptide repeat protein [Desulfobulbus sp. TB]|nr:tetratricopeptide repeat protein [Desulfobulbus sp. TB]